MSEDLRFASKVDTWLAVVLWGSLALMVATAVILWWFAPGWQRWTGMLSLAFVVGLCALVLFPLYYSLEKDLLLVRSGVLRTRIPYSEITKVEPSGNPLSSPALSLDRLHVHAEGRFGVLISPLERERFLTELLARCPHLRREGDRLVRP